MSRSSSQPESKALIAWMGLAQIIAWGSIYYLFALLIVPLERELQASRAAIAGAFSACLLASGLTAPWVGRLIDRNGGRMVMTAGSIASALLLVLLSQVRSLAMLYLVWAALGVAMAAMLYEAAFAVVTQAFPNNYRRAIATLTLFGGFASTIFWPLTAWMMEAIGWRNTALAWAALNLGLCAPIHFWLVPTHHALRPATSAHISRENRKAWLGNPVFLAFGLAFVGQALAISALGMHLLTLFVERGLSVIEAATIGAMIGPMQVIGRLIEMSLSAHHTATSVGRWAVCLLPISLVVLLFAGVQGFILILFAGCYGIGNGTMTIVRGAAAAELFGREAYGEMMGLLALPAMLARAAGPVMVSLIWSAWGGYQGVVVLLCLVAVGSAVAYGWATRHARALA